MEKKFKAMGFDHFEYREDLGVTTEHLCAVAPDADDCSVSLTVEMACEDYDWGEDGEGWVVSPENWALQDRHLEKLKAAMIELAERYDVDPQILAFPGDPDYEDASGGVCSSDDAAYDAYKFLY